jgi:hypothetical protein
MVFALPPLLGLLATQGARVAVTKAIQNTALTGARASKQLASKIKKNYDTQKSKGIIPSKSKLLENLSTKEKNIIKRSGLLDPYPAGAGKYALTGGGVTKIPTRTSDMFPIPTRATSPISEIAGAAARRQAVEAERQAGRAAFNRGRGMDMLNKPIVQTADPGRGLSKKEFAAGAGLLSLPMFFGGSEETLTSPVTGAPLVPTQTTQDRINVSGKKDDSEDLRLEQILFPGISGKPTNKELINTAILNASLSLLGGRKRGETTAQSVLRSIKEGAQAIPKTGGKYETAKDALQAGKDAGFTEVRVTPKDGGYTYQGIYEDFYDTTGKLKKTLGLGSQESDVIENRFLQIFQQYKQDNEGASDESLKNVMKDDLREQNLSESELNRYFSIIDSI